jgi:hypothetical protein
MPKMLNPIARISVKTCPESLINERLWATKPPASSITAIPTATLIVSQRRRSTSLVCKFMTVPQDLSCHSLSVYRLLETKSV